MRRMRIAIVTDAWKPQINGVVQTLSQTRDELKAMGHDILMVTPENRRTIPMPTYPEIRLSLFAGRSVQCDLDDFDPDCIHIATEGPLGLAARRYCRRRRRPFTSAYHTRFPEYVKARFPVPIAWTARSAALVSRRGGAHHGAHRNDTSAARGTWFQQSRDLVAPRCCHRRLEYALALPGSAEACDVRERTATERREARRAEHGRLDVHRAFDRRIENISQKLQEPVVGGHPAVDADDRRGNAVLAHRHHEIVRLTGDGLQRRGNNAAAVAAAREPKDRAACGSQYGAPSPANAGTT